MKKTIRVQLAEATLIDRVTEALKDLCILDQGPQNDPADPAVIITDNITILSDEKFVSNKEIPVLYIAKPDEKIDNQLASEKNIFRILVSAQGAAGLDSLIEIPSKENPLQAKTIHDVVSYIFDVRNTIDKFKLLLESDGFEQRLKDEQDFTERGDYGREGQPKDELRRIRGVPRLISRVEAAYQAIQVYSLLEKPININGAVHKKILFLSPEPQRITKYATFLQTMINAIVEVASGVTPEIEQDIKRGNYSMLIYDAAQLDTPLDIKDLEELANLAWKYELEVLTLCNLKKGFRIIVDSDISYKLDKFLSENPTHTQFLDIVTHILKDYSKKTLIKLLDRPHAALFSDAIENLLKTDAESVERGKNQLRHAISITTGKGMDQITDFDVLATDDLFTSTPLKLPDIGYLIKFFKDERRAKSETLAIKHIHAYNQEREAQLAKKRTGNLKMKDDLFWTNMPRINTREKAMDHDKILVGSYIKGPILDQLIDDIGKRIQSNDKTALEFRNRTIFEMNQYCAFFQIFQIPLPDVKTEKTNNSKDFGKIIENTKILGISLSGAEYKCAELCADIFDINITDSDSTQYFDFYQDNIIFETGNDNDTFADILNKIKVQGTTIKDFVEDKIRRIDFNKIYRLTSMTEDPSRFAVINFMRVAKNQKDREFIEEDRAYFYTHLLMYRKKFKLLKELQAQDALYDNHAPKIDELNKLIEKWENKYKKVTDKDQERIDFYIDEEKKKFFYIERYITAYRTSRHSTLLFNSIPEQKKRLSTNRITADDYERTKKFIEKDLQETYMQASRILGKIINEKKECIEHNGISIDQNIKDLFINANRDLTPEHAKEFTEYMKEVKKIEDVQRRNALFTYASANYLCAFFKKISSGPFNIDYEHV